ncbi:MAG: hypothetical protein K2L52_01160 [Clostridia bacterium]|nr:hypothetical protein [Clostridia bacterium]
MSIILRKRFLRPSQCHLTLLENNAILFDRLTELKGENGLYDWIKMFVRTPFKNIDKVTENEIISAVVSLLKSILFQNGKWYADYVRLRYKAIKC